MVNDSVLDKGRPAGALRATWHGGASGAAGVVFVVVVVIEDGTSGVEAHTHVSQEDRHAGEELRDGAVQRRVRPGPHRFAGVHRGDRCASVLTIQHGGAAALLNNLQDRLLKVWLC